MPRTEEFRLFKFELKESILGNETRARLENELAAGLLSACWTTSKAKEKTLGNEKTDEEKDSLATRLFSLFLTQ